jgi:hypothetical protein
MKTTKRLMAFMALAAVLVFSGCEGESPTEPNGGGGGGGGGVTPPTAASIVLTASNESPIIQSTTTITATVTQNGQPVPNGTAVEFQTTVGTFADTNSTLSLRTTTNGVATVVLTSANAGVATVTARVNTTSAQIQITFRTPQTPPPPLTTTISSITPAKGGPGGGQEVIIRGQNFRNPVRVLFGDVPAASQLISSTEIRAVVPSTNLGPSTQFREVEVVVISEAGTPAEQRATSPTPFRYELEVLQPLITLLSPSSGPNEGNTRVTIFGEGFQPPLKVYFGTGGGGAGQSLTDEVEAEVQASPTFNQVVVLAPPALGLGAPLANRQVTVRVVNVLTGNDAVKPLAYRYGPSMEITAAGPTTLAAVGGQRVEIDGWGFDEPVAVTLGGIAADPIFVSGTKVIVMSGRPIIQNCAVAGGGVGPVSVTNVEDGNNATGPIFTYVAPQVSIFTITPSTVAPGGTVTIGVAGASGGPGRVVIGGRTVTATFTGTSNGVSTYTFVVPSNLQFLTEPCSGVQASAPVPTSFTINFEDLVTGCDDELTEAVTVTPPATGRLTVIPQTLSLSATVGASNASSFTIVNTGAGSLTVNSVTSSGPPFTVNPGTVPQTLSSCATMGVGVTFTPAAPGAFTGTATVSSNAGNASVALSGTATAPAPPP